MNPITRAWRAVFPASGLSAAQFDALLRAGDSPFDLNKLLDNAGSKADNLSIDGQLKIQQADDAEADAERIYLEKLADLNRIRNEARNKNASLSGQGEQALIQAASIRGLIKRAKK
jgi:hypothetical protein